MKLLVLAAACLAAVTANTSAIGEDSPKSSAQRAAECANLPPDIAQTFGKEFPHNGPAAVSFARARGAGLLVRVSPTGNGCYSQPAEFNLESADEPNAALVPDLAWQFLPTMRVYVMVEVSMEEPDGASLLKDSTYAGWPSYLVLTGTVSTKDTAIPGKG